MKNSILLYDDYCPMCSCYSNLFVKSGLLKKENRVAFSTASKGLLKKIDLIKGKDEIPLYNIESGKTVYGIDALLEILGSWCGIIKYTGHLPIINALLKKIYKLISYNRKIIVAKKCGPGLIDCSPAFNLKYRIAFLAISLLFNTLMLIPLQYHFLLNLPIYHTSLFELQMAHLIFVSTNCCVSSLLPKNRITEYLGQINMTALIAILLFAPVIFFNMLLKIPVAANFFILLVLSAIIIYEYFRRMKYAGITHNYKPVIFINCICLLLFLIFLFK